MQQWIRHWNHYWFPETSFRALGISRIVVVGAQLLLFFPSIEYNVQLLEGNPAFISPQIVVATVAGIFPAVFTPEGLAHLQAVTILAGVACLVGLLTRTSAAVFALGNWVLIAHRYSYADIHHPEAIWGIFLMLLAFSPSGNAVSLDAFFKRRLRGELASADERTERAVWPLKLVHVLLGWTYFSTGLAKLLYGGLQWMNGYTLQHKVLGDAVRRDLPLGIWLAQEWALCLLLSVYTILFEVLFVVSVFLPRTAPFFLINGILFQAGLYLFAGHPFFEHMILLTLLLVLFQSDSFGGLLPRNKGAITVAAGR